MATLDTNEDDDNTVQADPPDDSIQNAEQLSVSESFNDVINKIWPSKSDKA